MILVVVGICCGRGNGIGEDNLAACIFNACNDTAVISADDLVAVLIVDVSAPSLGVVLEVLNDIRIGVTVEVDVNVCCKA